MSNKIRAIIIDDEESARHILGSLLARISHDIEIITKCSNLEEGVISIKAFKPDLVFLDIEMPQYAGYEITSFFDKMNFEIIFVTAYDHYAVKAFEVAAVDYILKPISIDRLTESIEKYKRKAKNNVAALNYQTMMETLESNTISKLVVPTIKGQKVIFIKDIVSIEASRAYCTIHAYNGESYILSKNLKHFETLFAENSLFFRCHKSWIINTQHVDSYSKSELSISLINGQKAKLSKYKKAEFEFVVSH
ncbi:MAG: hypothetical protein COA58_11965 [Bacteroidetes bacterium]|nr:MAG: hypothetical protein COA58_11965 [Bacteroidota bacterium]